MQRVQVQLFVVSDRFCSIFDALALRSNVERIPREKVAVMFSLEVGEDEKAQRCHCCGEAGSIGHGFIYRNGSAYGINYVAWSGNHPDRGVSLAVAVGEWDEGTTSAQRTCMGVDVYEGESEIYFHFSGPEVSPWPNSELLGPMLEREVALVHPLKAEFLEICEVVVRSHPAVARFLKAQRYSGSPSLDNKISKI
jgi:hypothetical protein